MHESHSKEETKSSSEEVEGGRELGGKGLRVRTAIDAGWGASLGEAEDLG